ncbi:hypothetical protein LC605_31105 [Nostoc sp. CHAB 5836]|uniref:hypothetical protein n=1 Tax=Nostoc sp. CHAB 5836 TaxID=2780404 RepID=UPI001E3AEFE0|nr:hypothetical protein [Nostoc sp. CHAB 5836]MCC5619432.1 hypothetical protein [Nostoc sp. CHAB 5836]
MTTLALDQAIEQGAIANSDKSFLTQILEQATQATRSFLESCKNIWEAKQLPKSEWDEIKQMLGWNNHTANPYIKIWEWISDSKVSPYNLELLDINTIKSLCSDKYLDIWYQLQSSRMVVKDVRALMTDINKSLKVAKKPAKVLEWEQNKYGEDGDARLIIRLEDRDTGVELERQFKESGKVSVSLFLKELLRRPTVDEQVMALQEFNTYIQDQQPELPPAKVDRITELTANLRKIDHEIAVLIEDGSGEDTLPLVFARKGKSAIARELAMYGVRLGVSQ